MKWDNGDVTFGIANAETRRMLNFEFRLLLENRCTRRKKRTNDETRNYALCYDRGALLAIRLYIPKGWQRY